ncbi:MAG: glutathione peroxidase [Gammaproteobacteria bacterium]|nr:glutathione peroxidase [Gammaproteobacteria bacterium]MCW8983206.1 glutathione peroxidase [Gammaproteobacteria bacterium]
MLENREGQKVPSVAFHTRQDNAWVDVTTDEIFANKRVIVFSLPGAFTPTCSSSHVPRFNQLEPVFKANGIDDIVCISVNDAFVMNEWKEEQGADNITFIPDGNGEFSEGMGMLVDKGAIGFGKRSWRYAMVVDNGVVEKMFIEPDEPGDPYGVSDADTMLQYVAPEAPRPLSVTVFTRKGCPFCAKAKGMLHDAGIEFEELLMGRDYTDRTLRAVAGTTSVPQVFIDGDEIGGSDKLEEWLAKN